MNIDALKRSTATLQMLFAPATSTEVEGLDKKPEGFIAGWATTPTLNDYGQVVAPNAFSASIARRGLMGPTGIKLLLDHRSAQIAGVITKLELRGDRLWIEAQLDLSISYAADRYRAAKISGGLNFSIGFRIEEYSYDQKTEILTILRGDLHEVSVVAFPADEESQMLVVHSAPGSDEDTATTIAEFEKRLVALGLADSRRGANRIAREVKRHSHLFAAPADAPEADPDTAPPVQAVDHAQIAGLLAGIRSNLTRS